MGNANQLFKTQNRTNQIILIMSKIPTAEEIERTVNSLRGLGYKTADEISKRTNITITIFIVFIVLIILSK